MGNSTKVYSSERKQELYFSEKNKIRLIKGEKMAKIRKVHKKFGHFLLFIALSYMRLLSKIYLAVHKKQQFYIKYPLFLYFYRQDFF